jgi:hypothetical protein
MILRTPGGSVNRGTGTGGSPPPHIHLLKTSEMSGLVLTSDLSAFMKGDLP